MLGRSLVSWSSKKQNSVALSTAEVEYIATGACCAQILYMKQTLLDCGVVLDKEATFCRLRSEPNVLDSSNFKNEFVLSLALHCNICFVMHLGLV
jgi:hypothetical protein